MARQLLAKSTESVVSSVGEMMRHHHSPVYL